MHKAIPNVIEAGGGSIINISSAGGLRCVLGASPYCSSKAGLIVLTQHVAVYYGRQGIRSNVVGPGSVRTEMSDINMGRIAEARNLDRERAYRLSVSDQPLGRPAMPTETAPLCAYLASDESSFMTGAVLTIDGGSTMLDAGMTAMIR